MLLTKSIGSGNMFARSKVMGNTHKVSVGHIARTRTGINYSSQAKVHTLQTHLNSKGSIASVHHSDLSRHWTTPGSSGLGLNAHDLGEHVTKVHINVPKAAAIGVAGAGAYGVYHHFHKAHLAASAEERAVPGRLT